MMPRGSVNVWTCPDGHHTTAIHLHAGVTPMNLRCRGNTACMKMATSAGYPPGPVPGRIVATIAWEWVQPSRTQMKAWRRSRDPMHEHALAGGLIIRPLTDAGRQLISSLAAEPRHTDQEGSPS